MPNKDKEKKIKVYDKDKKKELETYDEKKGKLTPDKLFIKHHPETFDSPEQGHYETVKTYPGGGKDVKWVVDSPASVAAEAYDEYEDILVYTPYSDEELEKIAARQRIAELKRSLRDTDYLALKFAEGWIKSKDYEATLVVRQSWRDEINLLEEKLK